MRILAIGASAAVLLALSSCAGVQVVTEYKEVPVLPPEGMIQLCDISAPPESMLYVSAPWEVKEDLLTTYATRLILHRNVCNARIQTYFEWRKKQELLFKSKQGENGEPRSSIK